MHAIWLPQGNLLAVTASPRTIPCMNFPLWPAWPFMVPWIFLEVSSIRISSPTVAVLESSVPALLHSVIASISHHALLTAHRLLGASWALGNVSETEFLPLRILCLNGRNRGDPKPKLSMIKAAKLGQCDREGWMCGEPVSAALFSEGVSVPCDRSLRPMQSLG